MAARKAKSLAETGAMVKVVSPRFSRPLLRLAERGKVVLARKRFEARDLKGAFLAIACTDDDAANKNVHASARRKGVLVNVVDAAGLCDFIVPSVVSRGALRIAISTSGVSPALARRMRKDLEKRYGPGYADFLELMANNRNRIIKEVPRIQDRKRIFEAFAAEGFLSEFLKKNRAEGKKFFEERLKELLSIERSDHV